MFPFANALYFAGRLLKSSIDESVNPCTDFYQYACGNFQRQLPYGERYRDFKDLVNDELAIRMHGKR
jgi:hypothetical protein